MSPKGTTEALLIVENAFHRNSSPYGFNSLVSRGAPKKGQNFGPQLASAL